MPEPANPAAYPSLNRNALGFAGWGHSTGWEMLVGRG